MMSNTSTLQRRFMTLRWVLALGLGLLAVLYEIGPGRWIHDQYSSSVYFDLDIAFYGLGVPALAFATLTILSRWLDQKEKAEQQARTVESRLASILLASADAIITLDSEGCIDSWNRGAELLFGYGARDMQGRSFYALLRSGEAGQVEFDWLTQSVRQSGFVRQHETTCRDAAGREIAVELTATTIATEDGHGQGMSIILRDVTERKHRDEEIRRLNTGLNETVSERTRELAEKVEELARANADLQKLDQMRMEFVSVVAHQLRAPLTNMQGAVERMGNDCLAVN
ncbi:MAG TPA: PAS domain S-box protein, partial [Aggregatilineales bacterium]|nr:PAS domain S-box protein [Aggregatilineales bacterium]